jgi:hypothetical protein
MTHKDRLGSFILPTHLLDKINTYVPPTISPMTGEIENATFSGDVWQAVETFQSTKGNSIHTVSRRGNELKCTCQGFRIQKKGACKHTLFVAKKLGL